MKGFDAQHTDVLDEDTLRGCVNAYLIFFFLDESSLAAGAAAPPASIAFVLLKSPLDATAVAAAVRRSDDSVRRWPAAAEDWAGAAGRALDASFAPPRPSAMTAAFAKCRPPLLASNSSWMAAAALADVETVVVGALLSM